MRYVILCAVLFFTNCKEKNIVTFGKVQYTDSTRIPVYESILINQGVFDSSQFRAVIIDSIKWDLVFFPLEDGWYNVYDNKGKKTYNIAKSAFDNKQMFDGNLYIVNENIGSAKREFKFLCSDIYEYKSYLLFGCKGYGLKQNTEYQYSEVIFLYDESSVILFDHIWTEYSSKEKLMQTIYEGTPR